MAKSKQWFIAYTVTDGIRTYINTFISQYTEARSMDLKEANRQMLTNMGSNGLKGDSMVISWSANEED